MTDRKHSEHHWALVTGASAGIGAEFCRQLAALGYNLVLVARREHRLQELAADMKRDFGTDSLILTADLSLPGAGSELAKRVREAGKHIDFLVNNAGYGMPGHYTEGAWDQHAAFIQLMVTAVCELTRCLLPGMQARRGGYIINVSSLAALIPGPPGHTLYGASKAFLVRFSESLAAENRSCGVRVSALCPGFTYSEFHDVNGTRGLVSQLPSWMWMNAPEVVRYGIDSVMRARLRVIAIPGRANRLIAMLVRILPGSVMFHLGRRMSRRYRAQKAE